jgi:hypothetical protein
MCSVVSVCPFGATILSDGAENDHLEPTPPNISQTAFLALSLRRWLPPLSTPGSCEKLIKTGPKQLLCGLSCTSCLVEFRLALWFALVRGVHLSSTYVARADGMGI